MRPTIVFSTLRKTGPRPHGRAAFGETRPRALNPVGAELKTALRVSCAMLLAAVLTVSGAWAKPAGSSPAKSDAISGSGQAGAPKVDSATVHRLYLDGEFDAAIAVLEENLKETR